MLLVDVMKVLDELAPLRYAESWDNVGLLVGDPRAEITRVLVTVDYTGAVADEAVQAGASLVIAYHPAIFAAVKRVPHDALWADVQNCEPHGGGTGTRRGALMCPRRGRPRDPPQTPGPVRSFVALSLAFARTRATAEPPSSPLAVGYSSSSPSPPLHASP